MPAPTILLTEVGEITGRTSRDLGADVRQAVGGTAHGGNRSSDVVTVARAEPIEPLAPPTLSSSIVASCVNSGATLTIYPELSELVIRHGGHEVTTTTGVVLSSEVVVNGKSVTRGSAGRQVIGAAVGGMLLGPAGLLLGGLTGKKTTVLLVHEISLRVLLSCPSCRVVTIGFLKARGKGYPADGADVKRAESLAYNLHSALLACSRDGGGDPPPIDGKR